MREKLDVISLKKQKLRIIINDAQSIVMVNIPDPTKENPGRTKKKIPKDRMLDTPYKDARRQAIYDKIIVDVAAL